MSDEIIREWRGSLDGPTFTETAFTVPPPLQECRVAIVTTCGLLRHGEPAWTHEDSGFRLFDASERDLIVGHVSMHFDRSGIAADLNVIYPIDRLHELAAEGTIGSVSPIHAAFMGATYDLTTIILDTGPAAARALREADVHVVILTPACPVCTRTICTLAHVLEREGLATIAFCSNKGQMERFAPPRGVYCEFPIGRPLGKPRDAAFQHDVLRFGFACLEQGRGPVKAEYPEAIYDEAHHVLACNLPPRFDPSLHPAVDESRALRPAWDRTRQELGRTQVGRAVDVDEIPDAIARFVSMAEGASWSDAEFPSEEAMWWTAVDVRAYYEEAALALVDHVPAARTSESWIYQRTEVGKVLRAVAEAMERDEPELSYRMPSMYIVPPSQRDDYGEALMAAKGQRDHKY